jgi:uncharacterized protein
MDNVSNDGDPRNFVAPISLTERVLALDVLRGFALFGILVVNILDYAPRATTAVERTLGHGIAVFADGTFYPLFALLFGVGFAVFMDRAAARGRSGVFLYARRVLALLVIAVLQIVLLEDRNILIRYSFLALPLLFFWRASARVSFGAALAVFAIALGREPVQRALVERTMRDPVAGARLEHKRAGMLAQAKAQRAEFERVAATRSFGEFVSYRARWVVPNGIRWSTDLRRNFSLMHILAMFLLGAAAWRAEVFVQTARHRRRLGHVFVWGAIAGLAGNLAVVLGPSIGPIAPLAESPLLTTAITFAGNSSLTLAYVAGILLLLTQEREVWRRRLAPLAVIGRMGLTNYLWQSVAMSVLFLPYGFGLNGALPFWVYPVIGALIFASHIPMSYWWLARHRFGPVEWIWRLATYGRLRPLRQSAKGAVVSAQA